MTSAFMGQFQTGLQNASQNFARSYDNAADRRQRAYMQQQQIEADRRRQEENNQFAMGMEGARSGHEMDRLKAQQAAEGARQQAGQKFTASESDKRRAEEVAGMRAKAGDYDESMGPQFKGIAQRAYTSDPNNYEALNTGKGLPGWLPQGQTTERQDATYVPPAADPQGRGLGQPGSFPMQQLMQVPKAGGAAPLERAPGVHAVNPGDEGYLPRGPAFQTMPNSQRAYVPLQDTLQQPQKNPAFMSPGVAPLGHVQGQTTRSYTPAPEIQNALEAQKHSRAVAERPYESRDAKTDQADEASLRRLDQEALQVTSDQARQGTPGYEAAMNHLRSRGLAPQPPAPYGGVLNGAARK
jgi:hypothetical protein